MKLMKQKRSTGRPTVRTADTAKKLCECVARGMPFNFACAVAGIGVATFHDWRNQDPAFKEEVEAAIARGVNSRLKTIEESAAGDWRAAAWLLEHCQPQHFARNRLEVTGPDGAPLTAGVQLYLPAKDNGAVVETEPVAPALITEGSPDGNGN